MTWLSGVLALVFGLTWFTPIPTDAPAPDSVETHCVVHVVDQRRDGAVIQALAGLPISLIQTSEGSITVSLPDGVHQLTMTLSKQGHLLAETITLSMQILPWARPLGQS